MSKYDHASLVMIPSGFKAEKLYSVLPENGNGDFTHDRNGSTATRVNKDGYVETVSADVPRLSYPLVNGVVQDCPHLLLEPQRTNFNKYHTLRLETAFINSSKNANTTDVLSPANDNTATKVTADVKSSEGKSGIYPKTAGGFNHDYTANTDYVSSVFVKKGTFDFIHLVVENFSGFPVTGVYFDVSTGAVGTETNATGFIENYGNGWYRCAIKFNLGSSADLRGRVAFRFAESNGDDNVPRNGTEHMYFWGAQLEEGSYPTSLIQTSGTAETRSADLCNGAGTSAEFNDSEGVLFAECSFIDDRGTSSPFQVQRISVSDGTNDNRVLISNTITENQIQVFVRNSTGVSFNKTVTIDDITQQNKIALKYKANDFALWINGVELETDTANDHLPNGLNQLNFGGALDYDFLGKVKQVAVFNKALTDSELEALTT